MPGLYAAHLKSNKFTSHKARGAWRWGIPGISNSALQKSAGLRHELMGWVCIHCERSTSDVEAENVWGPGMAAAMGRLIISMTQVTFEDTYCLPVLNDQTLPPL